MAISIKFICCIFFYLYIIPAHYFFCGVGDGERSMGTGVRVYSVLQCPSICPSVRSLQFGPCSAL